METYAHNQKSTCEVHNQKRQFQEWKMKTEELKNQIATQLTLEKCVSAVDEVSDL